MGNSLSKKEIERQIEQEYKSLRKYFDEIYGDVTVVEHRSTFQRYALLEKVVDSSEDLRQKLTEFEQHDGFLETKSCFCRSTDMCSQSRAYHILLEYQENSVEKEVARRFEEQRYFSKEQLVRMMYQIVSVVTVLKRSDRQGRLLFHNKLFALTNALDVKVMDPLLLENKEGSVFEVPVSDEPERRFVFVAPETLSLLSHNQRAQAQEQQAQEKAQVWTVGVCFLEMVLLMDANELYDFRAKTIDFAKVREFTRIIPSAYGEPLQKVVEDMLEEDPKNRPRFAEVLGALGQMGGTPLSRKSSIRSPSRKQSLSLASRVVSKRGSN